MKLAYHDGQDIELEFDEKKHYYTVEGRYAPSVTTILDSIAKPALLPWAASEGAKWFVANCESFEQAELSKEEMAKGIRGAYRSRSRGALDVGMAVHRWCEGAILWKLGKGDIPPMPDGEEAQNSINAFREWVKENDVEWLTVEEKVYHRGHKYAGTVDATAIINEEYCVIDFKTSGAIYAPYYLQCAAYAKAIEDMRGKEVDKAYILRFDKKTGKFETGVSTEIYENFLGFLGFLDGYNRLKELENRK
jgi:genome maintenance exonuclease 1|tara:strand:+ start:789 stop:1535 length:747 start_codon:yes stop_codon:yes gene_type:complete